MLNKLSVLFLLLSISFAQYGRNNGDGPQDRRNGPASFLSKPITFEKNILPFEDNYKCFISYKIPFRNLLFTKAGDSYEAGLDILFNIMKDEKLYKRESSSKTVVVEEYNVTESGNDFLEGLISFEIKEGKYKIIPELNLENVNSNYRLMPIMIDVDDEMLNGVLEPIVISDNNFNCGNVKGVKLLNNEGMIQFGLSNQMFVFPVYDMDIEDITVDIMQNEEVIISRKLDYKGSKKISLEECSNSIVLTESEDAPEVKLFLLDDFSYLLNEGKATIKLTFNEDEKEFVKNVVWLNRPRTLSNAEFAAKLLRYIADDNTIDIVLDGPEEEYHKRLFDFWKQYDPDPETPFNEAMNEYYTRADFALDEFSTPSNRNGTKTDRGKIYIKYGEPDNIERSYNESNNVLEIWNYKSHGKRFVFIDNTGLGNFSLVKR
ncbi:MAG: GWxTD domain-containing protein [Ignavibacteria bacterium]|jgi:GWxTD domain-containing protein